MDALNRFHTPSSWRLARLEQVGLMLAAIALALFNLDHMRWGPFLLAFVAIDLLGYLPGALAHHRSGGAPIAPIHHHLYNLTHSYLSACLVISAWAWLSGGLEPAMLAFPIHLAGDRGVFGNTFKPPELPFEPAAVDAEPFLAQPTEVAEPALQELAS